MPQKSMSKKELSLEQSEELVRTLKARFEKNMNRHKGIEWAKVQEKLEAKAKQLWSLNEMERTGVYLSISHLFPSVLNSVTTG